MYRLGGADGWQVRADLDDELSTQLPDSSPVRVRSATQLTLELYGAQITAESPSTPRTEANISDAEKWARKNLLSELLRQVEEGIRHGPSNVIDDKYIEAAIEKEEDPDKGS